MIALLLAAALTGAPTAADFAFMAGTWESRDEQRVVRETWLEPMDGAMGGVGQTNRGGKTVFVEHMKITDEPGGVTFTAIVDKQEPTPFTIKSWDGGRYVFESPTHETPKRVIYWQCDKDLCARIEGSRDGQPRAREWRYKRVR